MTTTKMILAAAFTTALTLPLAVSASEEAQELEVMTVGYNDLNLSTEDGQDTLDRRLRHAARMVCGSHSIKMVGLVRASDNKACYDNALERARLEVHTLSAVATTRK